MTACRAAQFHAADMATRNYLNQEDPEGKGVLDRLAAVNLFPTVAYEVVRGELPREGGTGIPALDLDMSVGPLGVAIGYGGSGRSL
jgi:hypothetical protein